MQPTDPIYCCVPGPEIKAISIAKNNLGSCTFEHLLSQGLNGALSAYKHERRGIKSAVSGNDAARAGLRHIVAGSLLK